MKKPVFKYSKVAYCISAVLTVPLLIDICTACNLFSFWIAWILLILIGIVSIVRLVFAFRQHCYKFAYGLIGQLLLGVAILMFFQLSFNNVIETPVSHPVAPAVVDIAPPVLSPDSLANTNAHKEAEHKPFVLKEPEKTKETPDMTKDREELIRDKSNKDHR